MSDPQRRCLFGETPLTPDEWDRLAGWVLGVLFVAAGVIWWAAESP